ncbi:MAG TPA: SDR family oxidoreductase [Pedobacter sp.]|uniref:SDR family oxidoreductase n=1 Tax=Pedobacter sp. TaxID=1411316 RepID=UPI002D085A7A|nr:SDR family oxidoreductase [Pedobacter sp.]HMI04068.1 SDR family oxidoreductase [Pedobacter sp.]
METTKTWFITGASKGIGFELVKQALSNGDNVIAVSRSIKSLKIAFNISSLQFLPVEMDISSEESVIQAVQFGMKRFGKIDCLVNNAGYGLLGGIEESSDAEVRANFDINVYGLLNVTRAVLPYMRKAESGRIFNMSSVFGLIAGAGWGIYCATKFAVEGLSEALEQEVKPFGIKVTIIEPGYFRTGFLDSGSLKTPMKPISDYPELTEIKRKHLFDIPGHQIGNPVAAAAVILKTALLEEPPLRLLLGSDAVAYALLKTETLKKGIEDNTEISLSTDYMLEEA